MNYIDLSEIKSQKIIDTRLPDIFERGFIPGSINIGLKASFKDRMNHFFPNKDSEMIIISDQEKEVNELLIELGYTHYKFLKNGIQAYKDSKLPIDVVISISTEEFELDLNYNEEFVLDVRTNEQFQTGHVIEALNIPLIELENRLSELPKDKSIYVYCNGGNSSMVACSILRKNKYHLVKNVYGGLNAIKQTKVPVVK